MSSTERKQSRGRMFLCPKCQFKSPTEPRHRGETVAKSSCIHCYTVSENDKVDTWLEFRLIDRTP